jgi:hypothetical protein
MARPRKRVPLEDGLKLDLNKIRVQAVSQGEPTQQVIYCNPRYSADARRFGLLVWRFSSATRGSMRLLLDSLDQSIDLVAAPRHFGGLQWYFICPKTGRRPSVLWMPRGASCFASRQALGSQFAYTSQFQTRIYRANLRAHEIHCRLSGEDHSPIYHVEPPPKPRYMYRNTYERLLTGLIYAESKYEFISKG